MDARMEEMSFRSGVAVFAGVLALTGIGIALTVTLGGGHRAAAAPLTTSTSVTPRPVAPPSSASAAPSPSASPSATQDAPGSAPAAVNEDAPPPETTKAPAPQASPASSSRWLTPWPLPSRTFGPEQSLKTPPPWWFPWWGPYNPWGASGSADELQRHGDVTGRPVRPVDRLDARHAAGGWTRHFGGARRRT
jgi:hypothetical protein